MITRPAERPVRRRVRRAPSARDGARGRRWARRWTNPDRRPAHGQAAAVPAPDLEQPPVLRRRDHLGHVKTRSDTTPRPRAGSARAGQYNRRVTPGRMSHLMAPSPTHLTGSSPRTTNTFIDPTSVTRWSSPNRNRTCWARPSVCAAASSTGFMVAVVAPFSCRRAAGQARTLTVSATTVMGGK